MDSLYNEKWNTIMERPTNQSEVTRLLQQISEEYEAAQTGLVGYAITSRHRMITARLENIGKLHEELHALVGEDAIRLLAQQLDRLPDGSNECEGSISSTERTAPLCPRS